MTNSSPRSCLCVLPFGLNDLGGSSLLLHSVTCTTVSVTCVMPDMDLDSPSDRPLEVLWRSGLTPLFFFITDNAARIAYRRWIGPQAGSLTSQVGGQGPLFSPSPCVSSSVS